MFNLAIVHFLLNSINKVTSVDKSFQTYPHSSPLSVTYKGSAAVNIYQNLQKRGLLLHFFLYLIVISAWITATDKVANKASKEKLCTQYHRNKSDKEGSMVRE